MYRSLCVLLVLIAASESTFTIDGPGNVRQSVAKCKVENNVSEELINTLFSYKLNPEMVDLNGQCFVGCWLEQAGMLKSDGTVDADLLTGHLANDVANMDEVNDALRKCADQPGTGCTKKFKIAVCIERAEDLIKFRRPGYVGKRSEVQ